MRIHYNMIKEKILKHNTLSADIAELFDIFDGNIRLVGGSVRDILRHKEIHDYDFATPLPPETVIRILNKNHIRIFLTGLKHGTVTAINKGIPYEITTLRSDITTDGRHAEVHFVDSYEIDATRRDFTMNALYMDKTGKITDYVGGLDDLSQQCVRFIGHANQRVQEDYLRILRYFRFLADFGIHQIDSASLNACQTYRMGLQKISVERIRIEMLKLLEKPYAIEALKLMKERQVLDVILPDTNITLLEQFLKISPHATILERFAILVPNANKIQWKWSREQQKKLNLFNKSIPIEQDENSNRYLQWKLGRDIYLYHLTKAHLLHLLSKNQYDSFKKLTCPIFPITGGDLCQLGFKGSTIHQQLKIAELLWRKLGMPTEKKLVIENLLRYNEENSLSGEG